MFLIDTYLIKFLYNLTIFLDQTLISPPNVQTISVIVWLMQSKILFYQQYNFAQLELIFGLVQLELRLWGGGANLFLYIVFSWVSVRLHTGYQLSNLPGSALKVCVMVGVLEGEISDRLWLSFSITLANPNKSTPEAMKQSGFRFDPVHPAPPDQTELIMKTLNMVLQKMEMIERVFQKNQH